MKVKYEFVNETVEVEVDEQWATVIAEFDRRDYNNDKKETRRHYSIDACDYEGEEYGTEDSGIASLFEDTEQLERLSSAMAHLNEKQRDLVKAIYFDGIKASEYAAFRGISKAAVSQQLSTIRKKLKKYF